MHRLAVLVLVGLIAVAHAGDRAPLENQKIAYLLKAIETLNNAQFIRNGTAYDAKSAVEHLRQKLSMAGSRIKTADDFIRYCASFSSVSGAPYQIRFSDGRIVTSQAYLRQKLSEFRMPANDGA
jgi:Family of unknown function (DUF5329)